MDGAKPVSLWALWSLFFRIGLFSFGGQLTSWIHREVVTMRGWMSDEEFLSGFALGQIMPGVNSTNMAVFVGQRLRGALGAVICVTAMLAGPLGGIILAGIFYTQLSHLPGFSAIIEGVAAVALGLLARMGMVSARTAKTGVVPALVMAATFFGVGIMKWPMLAVVAVVAPISIVICYWRDRHHA
jgi:chromate transporter